MISRDNYRALREQMLVAGGTEEDARRAIEWVLGAVGPTIKAGRSVPIPGVGRLAETIIKAPKGKYVSPGPVLVYRYAKVALKDGATLWAGQRPEALS